MARGAGRSLSAAGRARLGQRLAAIRQGDVISLGATTIVGRGRTPTLSEALPDALPDDDQGWTLSLFSELGL